MATIIVESKWPASSSEKLAKTWLEMGEAPESQKLVWAGILDDIDLGVKGLVLWQCDDSKVADTLSWIRKDIVRYNAVPDFSCSVNICLRHLRNPYRGIASSVQPNAIAFLPALSSTPHWLPCRNCLNPKSIVHPV